MASVQLHLASSSPRRRDILQSLGVDFTQSPVNIDESHRPGEIITDMPMRLALEKVLALGTKESSGVPVLAADTAVVLENRVYGKPKSKDDALSMLSQLSGRSHTVITAVVLQVSDQVLSGKSHTEVRLRNINLQEAEAYWLSGEPADKAGAYAIQGLGGIFVEAVQGSYSGVVGLPVFETAALLAEAGIQILRY